jgi:hypothetical protein
MSKGNRRPGKVSWQQGTVSHPALPTLCIRGGGWNRKRPGSAHMRQAEGMGRPVHHGKRILSYNRLLCSRNAQWKGASRLGEVVGPNKEDPE